MSVLNKLASSLNRRDEAPNEELAQALAEKKDMLGIREIIDNLHNKNKNIQSDCIKVVYELAEIDPGLVSRYVKDLVSLLIHKNNRLQWGAMAVLDSMTSRHPQLIYSHLVQVVSAADNGSVITKDRCVNLLIKLCATKKYSEDARDLLLEQLQKSLPNQLPMYAENAASVMDDSHKNRFIKILLSRLNDLESDAKRKRIEKVIRKLS